MGYPRHAFGLRGARMLQAAKINTGRALRVGVVGVGVMGANHARVLSEFAGVELAGVVDPDRKQAHFVGGTLGCPALASIEELLDRGVDAVTIAAIGMIGVTRNVVGVGHLIIFQFQ